MDTLRNNNQIDYQVKTEELLKEEMFLKQMEQLRKQKEIEIPELE